GTPRAPVTYRAYCNEMPILSGGRTIDGWTLVPAASDLPQARRGAPPFQENLWMAKVPGIREGGWYFHELFVNGQRRQRARTPNGGFVKVNGEISSDNPARFRFHPGDISLAWTGRPDVEVVALENWAEFRMPL